MCLEDFSEEISFTQLKSLPLEKKKQKVFHGDGERAELKIVMQRCTIRNQFGLTRLHCAHIY